jgi:hybrid cluster-associated redox disulfide protein
LKKKTNNTVKNKNKKIQSRSKNAKKIKKRPVSRNSARFVTKKMTFGEIMSKYPAAAEVFMKRGMHCFGCGMAMYETLEQGAMMHGMNADKLVEEINKKIAKEKK